MGAIFSSSEPAEAPESYVDEFEELAMETDKTLVKLALSQSMLLTYIDVDMNMNMDMNMD